MDHIDTSNVTNISRCKLSNALIMPSNQEFVSTACTHLLRITHVRSKCVVSVTRDIITCCIETGKINQLMTLFTRGKGQIFIMGRLNTPLGVPIVTTRTMPSFPGCMSGITAVGHWRGAVLTSLSRTRSPGCTLGDVLWQR